MLKQKELAEWQNKNFDNTRSTKFPQWCLIGAMEEMGELSHALLKHEQGIRGYDDEEKFLTESSDAICDVIVYLTQMATSLNLDLEKEYSKVVNEVLNRDWVKDKKLGVGNG